MLLPTVLLALIPQGPLSYAELGKRHLEDPDPIQRFVPFDLDGDGAAEILTIESRPANNIALRLWRNDGKAGFDDVSAMLPAGTTATDARAGDLDGDGDVDLLLVDSRVPGVRVLRNDGATFTAVAGAAPNVVQASAPQLVDLDGDGDLDLVLISGLAPRALLNDGTGRFADPPTLLPIVPGRSLRAGDVDLDGDVDLVAADPGQPTPTVLRNDGTATFTVDRNALPAWTIDELELADLDGDGDLDAIVTRYVFSPWAVSAHVLQNDGSGRFTDLGDRGMPRPTASSALTVADVDGNGAPDALWFSLSGSAIALNDGTATFTAAPFDFPEGTEEIQEARPTDLDGDLDVDLLCTGIQGARMLVNRDRGRFTQALARNLPASRFYPTDVEFADVRFADVPDLVATDSLGTQSAYFRNDGYGSFSRDASVDLGAGARRAIFVDVNGDRLVDIVTASGWATGAQDRLLLNVRGRFTDATRSLFPHVDDRSSDVVAGDLDGDGDADLAFRTVEAPRIKLWVNDGRGAFSLGGSIPAIAGDVGRPYLGDVDQDGDLDLWLGRTLLLNDGRAGFTDGSSRLPPIADVVMDVVPGDLDGDGDLDAYVARTGFNAAGGQDVLLENQNGHLVDVTIGRLPIALDQSIRARLVDLDQDGDLDVVVQTNDGDKILTNDGRGRFRPISLRLPPSVRGLIGFADVDLDGDLDLLSGPRVLRNLRAQVDAPRIPIAGGAWPLDVYGRAGSAAFGIIGTRPARIPVPGIGLLLIDPQGAGVVGGVTVPPGGPARIPLRLPPSASLIGLDVLVQGVVVETGGTVRLTNAVPDTVH